MKNLSFFFIILLLVLVGCATTIQPLATVDYNPVNEWDATKNLFVKPFHNEMQDSMKYNIEMRLSKLTSLIGRYIGLNFVETIDSAETIIFIAVNIDTVEYTAPGFNYGSSSSYSHYFFKAFQTYGHGWSINLPPQKRKRIVCYVSLWINDSPILKPFKYSRDNLIFISYASRTLGDKDPLVVFWRLLSECVYVIPQIKGYDIKYLPKLGHNLKSNWLGGVKLLQDYYQRGQLCFEKDDVIFELDGKRIYDFLDYKEALLSYDLNKKDCMVKFNRRGRIIEKSVRIRW